MQVRSLLKSHCIGGLFLTPSPRERVWNCVADKFRYFHSDVSSGGYALCGQESFSNSLASQIVSALQLGDRSRASGLFSHFSTGNHVLSANELNYILGYCARKPDPLFVIDTWNVLEEKGVLNDNCYLHMVSALCNGGYIEEAFYYVKYIAENHRMNFILSLCNSFLLACLRVQDLKHACQCLDLMDSQKIGKNEVTYLALLKLADRQKSLSAVHDIWKEYVHYYTLNVISLQKFIRSFARLNDLQSAYRTLLHMVELVLKGKCFLPKLDVPIPLENGAALDNNDNLAPISMYDEEVSSNRTDSKPLTMTEADGSKVITVGTSTPESEPIRAYMRCAFNDVIHACAKSQNATFAEKLILQMQNLGLEPTRYTYNGYLKAVIRERGCSEGMKVLKLMLERKMRPYDSTLAILSAACSKELNLDMAEFLLNQISSLTYVDPFDAFFMACDVMDQPERALRMLAKMFALKIKPGIATYERLFSLFVNVNAPYEEGNRLSQAHAATRLKAIEKHMLYNGIEHSSRSLNFLLRALGAEGMVKEMIQYLKPVEHQLLIQNSPFAVDIFNTVLHALLLYEQTEVAVEMFKSMKRCGIFPNIATYTIMIDCCSIIRCSKSASALFSMMIRDGFCPGTVTYTALMKIFLDNYDIHGALGLLRQTLEDGNQPDVLLFNTILKQANKKTKFKVLELTVELMRHFRISPDASTCHYVFKFYMKRGKSKIALEALWVLSLRMISRNRRTLRKRKKKFQKLVLGEEDGAELRIMQLMKNPADENLCCALLNLRQCAILGYTRAWEPNRGAWSKRLSRKFKIRRKQKNLSKLFKRTRRWKLRS